MNIQTIFFVILLFIAVFSWYSSSSTSSPHQKKKKNRKKRHNAQKNDDKQDSTVENVEAFLEPEMETIQPREKTKWKPFNPQKIDEQSEESTEEAEPFIPLEKPWEQVQKTKQRIAPVKITQETKWLPPDEEQKIKVHRVLRLKDPEPEDRPQLHSERDGFKNVQGKPSALAKASPEPLTRTQKKNQRRQQAASINKQLNAQEQEARLKAHRMEQRRSGANMIYVPPPTSNAWKQPKPKDDIADIWD